MTDKSELRAAMRATRKQLAALDPKAAHSVAGYADDIPGVVVHALYWPIGSELDPTPLAWRLAYEGYDLCLPVVIALDEPMIFRLWRPGDPLEPDAAGVPAPLPLAKVVEPELILTPLLAFDAVGGRLGQGGGHYDRTFAALPDALRIGLAYEGQRVDRVPMEAHDQVLQGVLTEVGYTRIRGPHGYED
ncbi:5-formyltetrahydrofolate cyclo-ligase [uncultured Brevundimonas sp.]|uniref:5-formyltetrahydrofolate cyclo-ligase n=1 Tax=uncultured Brevundimonas sp. TaxID=213418 RepID=UPI0030ECC219|tara:strand:- start:30871 stop:31437 length:567 start_codon:yes stop_codon:yes gene_type:complete